MTPPAPPPADVCVVGSINLDLVARTPRLPRPGETVLGDAFAEHAGGKGLNQAVAAARAGARTTLCGTVGDDEAGRRLREIAVQAGVSDEHVAVAAGTATGRALIAVSPGENLIVVAPGANSLLGPAAAAAAVAGARVVLAQLEVPVAALIAAFEAAHAHGATTILNPAPAESATPALLALCDVIVPNEHEAEHLGGAATIRRHGAREVVVTMGARGSVHTGPDGRTHVIPPFAVDAVDTTAAGDAFCGALAAALALGHTTAEALRFASAAGALAVTRPGAVPSIPLRARVEAFLDHQSPPPA